jgi:hypothetical protein
MEAASAKAERTDFFIGVSLCLSFMDKFILYALIITSWNIRCHGQSVHNAVNIPKHGASECGEIGQIWLI